MKKQKSKTRKLNDVKSEIKELRKRHERNYGTRKMQLFIPMLMSKNELDSICHVIWLEGYLQAIKDERGSK